MKKRLKKRIVGVIMLVVGVGLCAGGAFFAPLLIPGAAFVGSGLTIIGDSFVDREATQPHEETVQVQMAPNSTINFNNVEQRHRHHKHQEPVVLLGMAEAMENHEKAKI